MTKITRMTGMTGMTGFIKMPGMNKMTGMTSMTGRSGLTVMTRMTGKMFPKLLLTDLFKYWPNKDLSNLITDRLLIFIRTYQNELTDRR